MFKKVKRKLKNLLYKIGYIKLDTYSNKIDLLMNNLEDIDIYSRELNTSPYRFVEVDVILHIFALNTLLETDFVNKPISVKKINEHKLYHIKYREWFTNNKSLLEDDNLTIKSLLEVSKAFINKCDELENTEITGSYILGNIYKVRPYYNNTKLIIDDILDTIAI